MLQKAVKLEVTEFWSRGHYQRSTDDLLRGYRSGYEDEEVQTGEGSVFAGRFQHFTFGVGGLVYGVHERGHTYP